jgi:hypothetical protein
MSFATPPAVHQSNPQTRNTMTTRELIKTIREHKDGVEQFNALLEECAAKIEDFLGGPEPETGDEP